MGALSWRERALPRAAARRPAFRAPSRRRGVGGFATSHCRRALTRAVAQSPQLAAAGAKQVPPALYCHSCKVRARARYAGA